MIINNVLYFSYMNVHNKCLRVRRAKNLNNSAINMHRVPFSKFLLSYSILKLSTINPIHRIKKYRSPHFSRYGRNWLHCTLSGQHIQQLSPFPLSSLSIFLLPVWQVQDLPTFYVNKGILLSRSPVSVLQLNTPTPPPRPLPITM